jgi:hypothetical protein
MRISTLICGMRVDSGQVIHKKNAFLCSKGDPAGKVDRPASTRAPEGLRSTSSDESIHHSCSGDPFHSV